MLYFCGVESNEAKTQKQNKMNATPIKKHTVREIRTILFNTDKYTVIGADERTNKESRDLLYGLSNQDEVFNVLDNSTHLLIWNFKTFND